MRNARYYLYHFKFIVQTLRNIGSKKLVMKRVWAKDLAKTRKSKNLVQILKPSVTLTVICCLIIIIIFFFSAAPPKGEINASTTGGISIPR